MSIKRKTIKVTATQKAASYYYIIFVVHLLGQELFPQITMETMTIITTMMDN